MLVEVVVWLVLVRSFVNLGREFLLFINSEEMFVFIVVYVCWYFFLGRLIFIYLVVCSERKIDSFDFCLGIIEKMLYNLIVFFNNWGLLIVFLSIFFIFELVVVVLLLVFCENSVDVLFGVDKDNESDDFEVIVLMKEYIVFVI